MMNEDQVRIAKEKPDSIKYYVFNVKVADCNDPDPEKQYNTHRKIYTLMEERTYIGEFYVLTSTKANYYYSARDKDVIGFSLSKSFLFDVIFQKYP
jgi:hypothetical protein